VKRRWRILFLVFLLLLVGLAWVWGESRRAPAWYAPPDPRSVAVVEMAEQVEYGVVEHFHKIREDEEPWRMEVSDGQINAWLAARLPEWLAHEGSGAWPADVGLPQINIGENGIDIALEAPVGDTRQLLVSRLAPQIIDGRMRVEVNRVGVGRVAVPGAPAVSIMELIDRVVPAGAAEGDLMRQLADMLTGRDQMDTLVSLTDGRRVELLDMAFRDGVLELTNRTLPDAE